MSDRRCREVRRALALGVTGNGVDDHLRSCIGCRDEATNLIALREVLGRDAVVWPGPALDRLVRRRIAAGRSLLRPVPALGLAAAGLIALVTGVVVGVVDADLEGQSVMLALCLAVGYLTLSSAALVPLLLFRGRMFEACGEVEA